MQPGEFVSYKKQKERVVFKKCFKFWDKVGIGLGVLCLLKTVMKLCFFNSIKNYLTGWNSN